MAANHLKCLYSTVEVNDRLKSFQATGHRFFVIAAQFASFDSLGLSSEATQLTAGATSQIRSQKILANTHCCVKSSWVGYKSFFLCINLVFRISISGLGGLTYRE